MWMALVALLGMIFGVILFLGSREEGDQGYPEEDYFEDLLCIEEEYELLEDWDLQDHLKELEEEV